MKNLITTFLSLLIVASCSAQTYTIEGKIKGLKSDSLLFLKIKQGIYEGIKVKAIEGAFTYTDSIREPYFVQILKLKKNSNETDGKLTEFLVEAGRIKITGVEENPESIQVKGSKTDLILKHYLQEDAVLGQEWSKLKTKYDLFVQNQDTINRKETAKALNLITFSKRIPLLKQYVASNASNIAGALIPNFCTLSEVLKKEDYLEMFNSLSPQMRKTNYGKSIYNRTL